MPSHERFSAQDAVFLGIENENAPMHVGAVMIFDGSSLTSEDGRLDIDSIRNLLASRLGILPRYRQRVVRTPISRHPVWVDDEHFDIRHHLKHVTLPRPGDTSGLQDLTSEFLSRKLDLARPLWEVLIVDGLADGRVAAIPKAHHSLVDGVSGIDLLMLLLSPNPVEEVPEAPIWSPSPAPSKRTLLEDEVRHRTRLSTALLTAVREAVSAPGAATRAIRERAEGLVQGLAHAVSSASETPLDRPVGPNRRFRILRVDLDVVKKSRKASGGTVNDVVLGVVAGALRRFLQGRGTPLEGLDLRAMIPVSTRAETEHVGMGNKIAVLVAPLPVAEPDARKRLLAVHRTMQKLKGTKIALATDVLTRLAEWTTAAVLSEAVKLSLRLRSTNIMVTNIRGPADPLYCLTAPMLEIYPAAPLWREQTLGVGVLSYAGFLYWGINADWDHTPDVDDFVDALRTELQELVKIQPRLV